MSLDLNKLEKVRDAGNGAIQARCPACAEAGQDRKGEHLRIQPDGKFGCCVFPQDHLHRKRIFALAGDNQPRIIRVRVQTAKKPAAIKNDVLGRLGRVFPSQSKPVEPEKMNSGSVGTLGTAETKSMESPESTLGTLGTPLNPHAYSDEVSIDSHDKLIGFSQSVPSVPGNQVQSESESAVPSVPSCERMPYLLPSGNVIIPFDCPPKYRWWAGGQSRFETQAELKALRQKSST